jgi:hypothetical protein
VPRAAVKNALLGAVVLASWLGIALQLIVSARLSLSRGDAALRGVLQALAYFTVLTNLMVALGASVRLVRGAGAAAWERRALAALAVYIFVVGLVYTLLLRQLWQPSGAQYLADLLLHDVVPVLYVAWWLSCAPRGGLRVSDAFVWLLWPLVYFSISMLVGHRTGRYLYPFADIGALGVGRALTNAGAVLALFLILGLLAVAFDRYAPRVARG